MRDLLVLACRARVKFLASIIHEDRRKRRLESYARGSAAKPDTVHEATWEKRRRLLMKIPGQVAWRGSRTRGEPCVVRSWINGLERAVDVQPLRRSPRESIRGREPHSALELFAGGSGMGLRRSPRKEMRTLSLWQPPSGPLKVRVKMAVIVE